MKNRRIVSQNSICLLGTFLWLAMTPAGLAQESKDITLKTKDGVKLAITYYPSAEKEHALPVVILHDQQDSRVAYDSIARKLQQPQGEDGESFAVVTVDLRAAFLDMALHRRLETTEAEFEPTVALHCC